MLCIQRAFVKHRLCLSCLLAVAGGLYLPVGQTPMKLRLKSTSLGFGFCFGWLFLFGYPPVLSGWVKKSGEFQLFQELHQRNLSSSFRGQDITEWGNEFPIDVILLWHCGSAKDLKSRKSSVCCHLPSFCRFAPSFYMPCECWQTEFSSDLCGKVYTKSTPFLFLASEKEQLSISVISGAVNTAESHWSLKGLQFPRCCFPGSSGTSGMGSCHCAITGWLLRITEWFGKVP